MVSNAALVVANFLTIGAQSSSLSDRIVVDGGTLQVTNIASSGLLDVRRGTKSFNAGSVEIDRLLVTNALGAFEFNGGSLMTGNTTNNNGRNFNVGNGSSAATLTLVGGGFHSFANGLVVRSNASGNGTIIGTLTVQNGGTLSPGTSLGVLRLNNPPVLQGTTVMEIKNNGSMLPNDQVAVTGTLIYGGALVVTNIGVNALTAGVEFPLFNANSYGGSFASITLPPLSAGLTWTNKLLVDGSIQVIGASGPKFDTIARSATNLIFSGSGGAINATYIVLTSTNLTLPVTNWVRLLTNQFDASGNFIFTDTITLGAPRQFYRLSVP